MLGLKMGMRYTEVPTGHLFDEATVSLTTFRVVLMFLIWSSFIYLSIGIEIIGPII